MRTSIYCLFCVLGLSSVRAGVRPGRQDAIPAEVTALQAVPAPGAVVIDGDLAEWDLSGGQVACNDVVRQLDTFSARVALMYDAKFLFVGIDWQDADPMSNQIEPVSGQGNGWRGDCVQLRFRFPHATASLDCWYYNRDKEVAIFRQSGGPLGPPIRQQPQRLYVGRGPELEAGYAMAFRRHDDGDGYVQEIRIPWARLPVGEMKAGDTFQMLLQLLWGRQTMQQEVVANADPILRQRRRGLWAMPGAYGRVLLSPTGRLTRVRPQWQLQLEHRQAEVRRFKGHTGEVRATVFSPAGRLIISAATDGSLRVWGRQSGTVVRTMRGHVGAVTALALSAAGKVLLSGGADGTVRRWDWFETGRCMFTGEGHTAAVTALALHPRQPLAASASFDCSVRLWNTETGACSGGLPCGSGVRDVAFSADGTRLAAALLDGVVALWDVARQREIGRVARHRLPVRRVLFVANDTQLLTAADDLTVRLWDLANGREVRRFIGHTSLITGLVPLPGERLLTCGLDGTTRFWDLATGREVYRRRDGEFGIWAVAVSADRDLLVTAADEGRLRLLKMPPPEYLRGEVP